MSTPNLPVDVRKFAIQQIPENVSVGDIARGLGRLARWGGDTEPAPYYVGQHCCYVAKEVMRVTGDPLAACYGLAHDAPEFKTGEICAPTKVELVRLSKRNPIALIEGAFEAVIFASIGIDWPTPPDFAAVIKDIDKRAAASEVRDLHVKNVDRDALAEALPTPIGAVWKWDRAEDEFIKAWDRYATMAGVPLAGRRTF